MEYILKVSPKGQITLPKKLRIKLGIKNLLEIEIQQSNGILKKPEKQTELLGGCFKSYRAKKKVPIEKALDKARRMVAHEIAQKDN